MDIILASKSPRRHELLTLLGLEFTVLTSNEPEPTPKRELSVFENLRLITAAKGEQIAAQNPRSAVIAADTVVVMDGEYFGKPGDARGAHRMLTALSGRTHEVYTGLSLYYNGMNEFSLTRTLVTFRELTEDEVSEYIATGEPMDKAGAYGIQGLGAQLVQSIDGDYFNVMGLPIGRLRAMLFNSLSADFPHESQAT